MKYLFLIALFLLISCNTVSQDNNESSSSSEEKNISSSSEIIDTNGISSEIEQSSSSDTIIISSEIEQSSSSKSDTIIVSSEVEQSSSSEIIDTINRIIAPIKNTYRTWIDKIPTSIIDHSFRLQIIHRRAEGAGTEGRVMMEDEH